MADIAEHSKLDAALEPVLELLGLYHVRFPADVSRALDAPTTEIAVWTLAPDTDRVAFHARASELVRTIYTEMPEEVLGGGLGDVVEDERRLSAILGWYSVEVRPYGSGLSGVKLRFLCSGSVHRSGITRSMWRP